MILMFETAAIVEKRKVAVTGKFPAATKSLAILDKFEGQENVGKERKQKVKVNKAVKEMQKVFARHLRVKLAAETQGNVRYRIALGLVDTLASAYSAEDVGIFCMSLDKFEGKLTLIECSGYFLSALMNRSKGTDFALNTENLASRISHLGYRNTKNIMVSGNVGICTGTLMKKGSIIVDGNARHFTGDQMKGGAITVNGDAWDGTGSCMRGGEIMVRGNVCDDTGQLMHGGKITVMGNAGDFTGNGMQGGEMIVMGNSGEITGESMIGGKLTVMGSIKTLGNRVEKAVIYQGTTLVGGGKPDEAGK